MRAAGWIAVAGVVIAGVAGVAILLREPAGTASSDASSSVAPGLIATSQPQTRTLSQSVSWVGVVESRTRVQLKALETARVEAVEARDESPVEPGAAILQLGGPLIELRRARLKADMESLTLQADLAGQRLSRLKQNLSTQLATAEQVATAQESQIRIVSQLRDAQLTLETLEQQLRVVAPVAGVFTNRRVSVGQIVGPGDLLGEIVDPNRLRIVASLFVPPKAALQGLEAQVRLDVKRSLKGVIRQVVAYAGANGETLVWIEGPQIDERLRPGQTVSGETTIAIKAAVITVPQSAIVYDANEQPVVFIEEDGTYESRPVRLGLTQDGWVEVLSGIQAGQSVVTQGAYELLYRRFNEQFKVED